MNYLARVYVEKLGLDPYQSKHLVMCPFHTDSQGASFSVDLVKSVHYCFGACEEPKGGGAIQFKMKWSAHKENVALTYDEARRALNRIFKLPGAKVFARQQMEDDVWACKRWCSAVALSTIVELQHAAQWHTADAMTRTRDVLPADDDAVWNALEEIHKTTSFCEYVYAGLSGKGLTPATLHAYKLLKQSDLWTMQTRHDAEMQWSRSRKLRDDEELKQFRLEGLQWVQAHVTARYEKGRSCRPKRTALNETTPPMKPLRQKFPPPRAPLK